MRSIIHAFLLLVPVLIPLAGKAQTETSTVRIEQPWARASIGTGRPAAAYISIINEGDESIRVTGFETPVAEQAEAHRTVTEDGMMSMQPAGILEVPAGERVVFEPGGLHLMLTGLQEPLEQGGRFPLTVRFDDNAPLTVSIPILGIGSQGPEETQ